MVEEILCITHPSTPKIVNDEITQYLNLKLLMVEEILCDARRQIRSIVNLCEEFVVRRTRAKFTHQNNFYNLRIE